MEFRNLVLLVTISSIVTTSADNLQIESKANSSFEIDSRLPNLVIPHSYDILLEVHEGILNGTETIFSGSTDIIFSVIQNVTDFIYIHAPLNIESITISPSNIEQNITSYFDTLTSILTIDLENNTLVPYEEYILSISYTGELDITDNLGIYRTSYQDTSGFTEYLLATQFQPDYARKVFPCFDEPQYKATFELKIIHPVGYIVSFHTREVNSSALNDLYIVTEFAATPIMSTYSLAFVVSKLSCSGLLTEKFVLHQVCSRPGLENDHSTANQLSLQLMAVFEQITGINETFNKIGHISIPDLVVDFTESWGLALYRERNLLYNAFQSSDVDKQRVAITVAHQLTQLWFGHLVTPKWWNDIFLSKGFAAYFDYYSLSKLPEFRDWELPKQFVVDKQQHILFFDGAGTSKALSFPAVNSAQIRNKFETLTYYKGASVLKMLENIIGEETFFAGIQYYLEQNSFKNVEPSHLWNALQEHITLAVLPNVALETVMNNWIHRPGYPLVQVSASGNDVHILQKRFLYNGSDGTEWYVPISYTTANDVSQFLNVTPKVWLIPGNFTLVLSGAMEDNSWIVLNNQASGYFRVNYDSDLWSRIRNVLLENHTTIDVLSRAQLVDDVFNLAISGELNYSEAIDILSYLPEETHYYPLYAAAVNFDILRRYLGRDSEIVNKLNNLELQFLGNLKINVSFTAEQTNQIDILRNRLILERLCKLEQKTCISLAVRIFQFHTNVISVNNNMKHTVYCYGLRHSENIELDWNSLWLRYQNALVASEKYTILKSLGCTQNITYLNNYLEYSIDEYSGITKQDISIVWNSIINSDQKHVDIALDFYIANSDRIRNYHTKALSVLSIVASRISNNEQLQKLENLSSDESLHESIRLAATDALSIAKNIHRWNDLLKPQIEKIIFSENDETEDGNSATNNKIMLISLVLFAILLCIV